jgi:hypothetical protein
MFKRILAPVVLLICGLSSDGIGASRQTKSLFVTPAFEAGRVMRGIPVDHTFVLKNDGPEALQLGNVRMSKALTLMRGAARVEPGAEASFQFRLDTSQLSGAFEGKILVSFGNASVPDAELTVTATVVAPIEASAPGFFVSVDRDQVQEQSVEIRGQEKEPLRIEKVDFSSERASVALETVDEGRRYLLKLTVKGEGAAGRRTELIRLTTSSRSMPVFQIPVNTNVRERVYTFPDAVDLGALPISAIRKNPKLLAQTAQTLMIYRKATKEFRAEASSDVPALSIRAEPGPAGDRWQFTVTLNEALVNAGPIRGSIIIETNDPEFPRMTVPVSGHILDR